ncbi:amidohydrolase family protein, partial [Tsukamurella pulmonis]
MTTELLVGGRIYTPTSTTATAIAVENGRISWIGEDRAARALHPDAQVTDLGGAFLAPAFVDTHVHLTATGLALTGPDLTGGPDAVRAALAAATGETVIARGWDDTAWERPLQRTDLDEARIVYAARVDEHSAQASTALRALVPGLADLDGFSPDGPLTAAAHHAVRAAALAALTDAQITAAQTAA